MSYTDKRLFLLFVLFLILAVIGAFFSPVHGVSSADQNDQQKAAQSASVYNWTVVPAVLPKVLAPHKVVHKATVTKTVRKRVTIRHVTHHHVTLTHHVTHHVTHTSVKVGSWRWSSTKMFYRWWANARMAERYGWHGAQKSCLDSLWMKESGWSTRIRNPNSAGGIPQALPATKMGPHRADYRVQIDWGLGYIKGRYGSPCSAWAHWQSHNWY